LPVRAASWWYVGQLPVGNAAVVALGDAAALGDAVALADAEADELAAAGDDAAAETGADEATADDAAADSPADVAAPDETGAEAAGAACLLDVQAASTRLPPTMAMSARRCPMPTSLPTSGPILTADAAADCQTLTVLLTRTRLTVEDRSVEGTVDVPASSVDRR
jgi:hypothetical protein